jgi:hypothetical protein
VRRQSEAATALLPLSTIQSGVALATALHKINRNFLNEQLIVRRI